MNIVNAVAFGQLGSAILDDPIGDYSALQDGAIAKLATLLSVESGTRPEMGAARPRRNYEGYLRAVGYLKRYDKP